MSSVPPTSKSLDQAAETAAQLGSEVLDELLAGLGSDAVLHDAGARSLYGQDVSGDSHAVLAVVRPQTTGQVAHAMQVAAKHGLVVVPRGGGMSYSGGYVCEQDNVLCIDSSGLNQVLEVNVEDMYVTVQAGCNWKTLYETLEPLGVRTPFWGTLSGIHATIGGGLSQNSIFWGSGRNGSAADSVVGFEVVLASGEVLQTGAGAQANATPFFRHYGPDLTGLFTCDTGALGVKTAVTLKLQPACPGRAYVSYDFAEHRSLIAAMSDVSRARLAEACFAFDPNMQQQRMKRESLLADVKALGNVVAKQGSVLKGLKEGVKVAIAGRGYMKDVDYSVHFMVEEATQAAADASAARIVELCGAAGGKQIENSIPKITRANPFGPLNSMVGPAGERWLPVHGLIPHSKANETFEAIEALFAENAELFERHNIVHGYLLTYIDTNCFVIEPVFYWPDELNDLHRATVDDAMLAKLNEHPANPAARAEVMRVRDEIMALFESTGGVHLQIGRKYRYQQGLSDVPRELVTGLKSLLDPDGRINPGSLGL